MVFMMENYFYIIGEVRYGYRGYDKMFGFRVFILIDEIVESLV